ncbi:hypothetical protein D3C78_1858880 [compost metagenome]
MVSLSSVAATSAVSITTMPMLINFSPRPIAFSPRYNTPAAGTKNSRLPIAGEIPNRDCSSLPLPVI